MQRGSGLVHESLQQMPILEKGLDAVIVELNQILSQRGEGSSNIGLLMSRGKQVQTRKASRGGVGGSAKQNGSGLESIT